MAEYLPGCRNLYEMKKAGLLQNVMRLGFPYAIIDPLYNVHGFLTENEALKLKGAIDTIDMRRLYSDWEYMGCYNQ